MFEHLDMRGFVSRRTLAAACLTWLVATGCSDDGGTDPATDVVTDSNGGGDGGGQTTDGGGQNDGGGQTTDGGGQNDGSQITDGGGDVTIGKPTPWGASNQLVAAGGTMKSAKFRMVFALGSTNQAALAASSPKYSMRSATTATLGGK